MWKQQNFLDYIPSGEMSVPKCGIPESKCQTNAQLINRIVVNKRNFKARGNPRK